MQYVCQFSLEITSLAVLIMLWPTTVAYKTSAAQILSLLIPENYTSDLIVGSSLLELLKKIF